MPFALFVEKLIAKVEKSLLVKHGRNLEEQGIAIPSISTVALQFAPPSPNVAVAARYTGAPLHNVCHVPFPSHMHVVLS
jgi:hypothetical protein